MIRKSALVALVVAISLVLAVPAFAAGPNFGSAIYADGETWGTKGTADLPAPTENNRQSFDGLFKIQNGVEGQLAVAEAAPGNPAYNGGRWIEYFVEFVDEGDAVLVTSYAQLHALAMDGKVTITETGAYFQCPLLPDKSQ
jgi:hypothetical protein